MDVLLADIEHQQGRPYTADPDHCAKCAGIDRDEQIARQQAGCSHQSTVEGRSVSGEIVMFYCHDCGMSGDALRQALSLIAVAGAPL
jgi:hypothetical protein